MYNQYEEGSTNAIGEWLYDAQGSGRAEMGTGKYCLIPWRGQSDDRSSAHAAMFWPRLADRKHWKVGWYKTVRHVNRECCECGLGSVHYYLTKQQRCNSLQWRTIVLYMWMSSVRSTSRRGMFILSY